jgi:hypothetical protein
MANIWQVFNSRATPVQPPTVALIVQNKRKLKKMSFTTDLNFLRIGNREMLK